MGWEQARMWDSYVFGKGLIGWTSCVETVWKLVCFAPFLVQLV